MQIAILTTEFPPGPGGIGDHAFNLSEQLVQHGHRVTVIAEHRVEFEGKWTSIRPSARVISYRRGKWLPNLELVFLFLRHYFLNGSTIWIASGSRSLLMVGLANLIWKKRTIAVLHGHEVLEENGLKSKWVRALLNRFSAAVAVSSFSQENASRHIEPQKTRVIPNGFDPGKFGSVNTMRLSQPARLRLLTVGRVSMRKGQHNVVAALPHIQAHFPSLEYHIVGMNDQAGELKSLIHSKKLSSAVFFHGVLSDSELKEILADTDVFLMLSENRPGGDVEGFGIAIIEANYFGIPAIGSKGCGVEQAIKDRYNGRLVSHDPPIEIADAVSDILRNYAEYQSNSRQWAASHTWEEVGKSYLELIQQVGEKS